MKLDARLANDEISPVERRRCCARKSYEESRCYPFIDYRCLIRTNLYLFFLQLIPDKHVTGYNFGMHLIAVVFKRLDYKIMSTIFVKKNQMVGVKNSAVSVCIRTFTLSS